MNKTAKWLMILLSATLLGAGAAAVVDQITYQNNGSIVAVGDIDIYVDDVLNPLSVDWATMEQGYVYYVNLTVVNKANTNVTVSLNTMDLPEGWVHSWTLNNTVWMINETKGADLDLTIPADAVAGDYIWTVTLEAIEVEG